MKILYIGRNASVLKKLLNDHELEIASEESGFTAFNRIRDTGFKPDAIVAELNLPGARGIDVKNHLVDTLGYAIPFILIADSFTRDQVEEWLKAQVHDAFTPNFDVDDLKKRIVYLKELLLKEAHLPVTFREYKTPPVKRIFDILAAGMALILLSPILLFVIVAIRLESKGKVYYISKRVGTGYRIFDFYKLRSMGTGADARLKDLKHLNQYADAARETVAESCPECARLGQPCSPILYIDGRELCERQHLLEKKSSNKSAFIKIKDDPRITRVGHFIRNTSIDELPQLINILKGDMSVVGNRPLPLYEAELLTSDEWALRFLAPAGLTGLWQTKKRGKGSMSDDERKGLDNEYAINYSIMNDFKIIFLTIPALFQKENV
jgi:lipopolysaccharide/colanic/teichoic acid biosynthesis glycosyltransferase